MVRTLLYIVASFVTDPHNPTPFETWLFVLVIAIGVAYFFAMYVIVKEDLRDFWGATVGTTCGPKRRNDSVQQQFLAAP